MTQITYDEARRVAQTGDVLLVEGRGWIGTAIRVLTGQQYSHVALCVWLDGGLWVAEMLEGVGFRLTPASQWTRKTSDKMSLGVAQDAVHADSQLIANAIMQARANPPDYSYWSLVTVWLSQILRRPLPAGRVCSTLVQRVWELSGLEFDETADPGNIARACYQIFPIGNNRQ